MLSAYTIRKVLPRLLIAAIAIQLSWSLCLLAISINNSVAHGVQGLIYAPFGGQQHLSLQDMVATGGNATHFDIGIFTAAAAGAVGIVAIGSGSVVGILALAGTAALGIIIALFTLVLRQAVLIFLVIASPLAIAAWVLPGTEKLWKMWWDSFFKLLIMYPLILLLVAAGRIFAYVSSHGGGASNEFLTFAMIIIGFFGPLFLIPATLKLAGTAFTAITGAVNSRNKGLFDRLRNTRAQQAEQNRAKFLAGHRFNGTNPIATRFQNAGLRANAGFGGRFGYGKRGAGVMANKGGILAAQFAKENEMFAGSSEDEKVMSILGLNRNRAAAEQWIKAGAAENAKKVTRGEMTAADAAAWEHNYTQALETASAIGFNNTSRRAALTSGGLISYGLQEGEKGWDQATAAMSEIAGVGAGEDPSRNETYRALMNQFQYVAKGMGRADLAGATDGGKYSGDRAWGSVSLYQHANSKPSDIKGASQHFLNKLASGDESDKFDAAVFYKELEATLPNSTGAVRDEISKQMETLEKAGVRNLVDTPVLDPATGKAATRRVAVRDPSDPNNMVWEEREITLGDQLLAGQIEKRDKTGKVTGTFKVRSYERPNADRLNEP